MSRCKQELCPNWSGDGDVCPCALFGIEPPAIDPHVCEVDGDDCSPDSCGKVPRADSA